MPNHVHLLISPSCSLRKITNGLKGASAQAANKILHSGGKHFWQDESYDHWLRTPLEFGHICSYIERNPVSAGLTASPELWAWSSASVKIPKSET